MLCWLLVRERFPWAILFSLEVAMSVDNFLVLSSSPSLALLSLLYFVVFVAAHVCIVKTHFKWLCQLVIHLIVIPLTRCWRFNNAVPPWYQDGLRLNTPLTLVGERILWAVLYYENCMYNRSLPLPCSAFSSSFLLSIFLLLYSITTLQPSKTFLGPWIYQDLSSNHWNPER